MKRNFYIVFEKVDRSIRGTIKNRSDKDVYLASFPKSGNTWLRFILGNLKVAVDEGSIEVNFHTINSLIPDVHLDRNLKEYQHSSRFPRIIKTHFPYYYGYPGTAIFLHRHPRDTLVSYYYYLRDGKEKKIENFSKFIRHERYGLPAWIRHSLSWVDRPVMNVSFDKLKNDTHNIVREIADYINVQVRDSDIDLVVKNSSFEVMRKIEQEKGDPYAKNNTYEFVRKGGSNYKELWQNEEDRLYLLETAGDIMKKLGYSVE